MIEYAERENKRESYRAEEHRPQMPVGSDGEYSSDMEVRNEEHEQEGVVDEQEANGDVDDHEQVEEGYASYDDDHYADDIARFSSANS
ncbi:hypothetical protein H4R27_002421 [Coemansia aciculifera]|nr:hypothetical protein H4R27_002421 [Coemansia aciculifera]